MLLLLAAACCLLLLATAAMIKHVELTHCPPTHSYKEITELAGYTYRVTDMLQVFDSVAAGRYSRGVDADTGAVLSGGGAAAEATRALLQARGTRQLSNDGSIEFDDVPIVSPIGDTLVKHLNFCITRGSSDPTTSLLLVSSARVAPLTLYCGCGAGMHTLITGPNGCGKSSLFRILGGLWPLHGGRLRTPARSDIFYVPQKPYATWRSHPCSCSVFSVHGVLT